MSIRRILSEDLQSLSELYVSVFKQAPWNEDWELEWALDRLTGISNSPGFHGYLLVDGEKPLAAALGRSLSFKGRMEFELVEFFVDHHHQGKGLGKKLLDTVENFLRNNDYSYSVLLTEKGIDAEAFYQRSGYKTSNKMVFMAHEL